MLLDPFGLVYLKLIAFVDLTLVMDCGGDKLVLQMEFVVVEKVY